MVIRVLAPLPLPFCVGVADWRSFFFSRAEDPAVQAGVHEEEGLHQGRWTQGHRAGGKGDHPLFARASITPIVCRFPVVRCGLHVACCIVVHKLSPTPLAIHWHVFRTHMLHEELEPLQNGSGVLAETFDTRVATGNVGRCGWFSSHVGPGQSGRKPEQDFPPAPLPLCLLMLGT